MVAIGADRNALAPLAAAAEAGGLASNHETGIHAAATSDELEAVLRNLLFAE